MMLDVKDLNAWYGRSHILQGISLTVKGGEIVSLIGRNGAGKTTTLRAIMGLMPSTRGKVTFDGEEILAAPPHARFSKGLGYVPEDRRIVPGLTVRENLRLGTLAMKTARNESAMIERIAETFPRLKERLEQNAATMSGGEQQMLAIARAWISNPKMIMLDEPSEGIMPVLVDEMFELFERMKSDGTTILLIEQNVEIALTVSDRAYILDQGKIVYDASAEELLGNEEMQQRYCSV
jgi:branched-chain amino acid transport system ATP-binding protein